MHTLREIIQHTIQENAGDPAAAAVEVCLQLERLVGLYGNGWFDNDALMLTHLEAKADGVVGQQAEPVLPQTPSPRCWRIAMQPERLTLRPC